ncbi:MAG: cellulose synthase operon protein YhjQ/BcsQ [Pirellulaceae bacterium]
MSTPDRAFFAAYSSDAPFVVGTIPANRTSVAPAAATSPTRPGQRVIARGPVAATEPVARRLDTKHVPPVAAPHATARTAQATRELLQTKTFEVACYTGDEELQTSCLVVAPALTIFDPTAMPPATPVAPAMRSQVPPPSQAAPAREPAVVQHPAASAAEPAPMEGPRPARPRVWKPVWELDEFVWSPEVTQLFELQTEYFRYAGTKLLDASREGLKSLAVVTTRDKEGCTTLVTCLARAVAAAGAKVALFDANLSNPELGMKLGLDFSRGWQGALDDPRTLDEAAVYSLQDGVTLFPLGVPHGLNSLHDPRVSRLFRQAAEHFDLVIVDAGTLPTGDVPVFELGPACPINAVMIVRDVRRTTEVETLITASRLKELGIEAIGIAENFCRQQPGSAAAA